MSDERTLQPAKKFEDPTAFGHSFMPPWSVTCNKCGKQMISYANEATVACIGCGGEVRKADPSIDHMKQKLLPAHSVISAEGLTEVKEVPITLPPPSRTIKDILKEQSVPQQVNPVVEPDSSERETKPETTPEPEASIEADKTLQVSLSEVLPEASYVRGAPNKKKS